MFLFIINSLPFDGINFILYKKRVPNQMSFNSEFHSRIVFSRTEFSYYLSAEFLEFFRCTQNNVFNYTFAIQKTGQFLRLQICFWTLLLCAAGWLWRNALGKSNGILEALYHSLPTTYQLNGALFAEMHVLQLTENVIGRIPRCKHMMLEKKC